MKTRYPWRIAAFWMLTAGAAFAIDAVPVAPAVESPTPLAAKPTPPSVVSFDKLVPFLPEPPAGWTAEKPSGSTNDIEVFKLTTAARTYTKGDEENAPVTTITIIDAGGHEGYFDVTVKGWQNESRTPEGYDRSVTIDGMPGAEHCNIATSTYSLSVVVGKRYFVQIEVTNQEAKDLRDWLKRIDLKKLAELK